ncbi:MaoC family dehydratase [Nocardiopsis baichengensis]|uniref:MaoC family dehydratase n=1 Tax=Nocardiopsis baichengensis TaxID=280240 RepID=UPI00034B3858|nr:MaoC family dehydratase [Nocardiopsis baichengensis]
MTAAVRYDEVEAGTELGERTFPVRRVDLVRYAGASGDFNPIHWNDRTAKAVGLPGVIAHGMFTMAEAVRLVTDWVGDPGAVVEYGTRFSAPVVVPDDDEGAEITVSGVVKEKRGDNQVLVALTVRSGGTRVLARPTVVVRLA